MAIGAPPVTIIGNLTEDPKISFTPNGTCVTKITVAVNHKQYNAETKRWEDSGTDFHHVTAWRSLAANVGESLLRGDRVIVVGTLKSSHYEDKEGNKRVSWEISAQSVGPDLMFASAKVQKTEHHKPVAKTEDKGARSRR